jgi:DNA polymerase-3 subunit alpha
MPMPRIPDCEPYTELDKLKIEKEVVGFYITGHPLDQFKIELENFCTCKVSEVEDYKNYVIHLAGIVSKFTERYTKNGKPFGLFSIEDFDGTLDVAMFGEEYLRNRHFLQVGNFLYLTGKVEERYNQPGLWEFRPKVIQLLNDVRGNLSDEVELTIDIINISEFLVNKIAAVVEEHPGKVKLKINLLDSSDGLKVDLLSKKFMIDPSNDFFKSIESLEDVNIRLVSKNVEIPADTRPDFKKFAKA